ncbi:hypothetical protein D3C76_1552720 [compost metagenome]
MVAPALPHIFKAVEIQNCPFRRLHFKFHIAGVFTAEVDDQLRILTWEKRNFG